MVAALIPDPGDPTRFLVQQRLPGKSRPLLWEFPGGKVEPGETDAQALVRECREELDVELVAGRVLWTTEHAYPDLTVELVLISAQLTGGEPKPLGAAALRFLRPSEMQELPFCEADLPLLSGLRDGSVPLS